MIIIRLTRLIGTLSLLIMGSFACSSFESSTNLGADLAIGVDPVNGDFDYAFKKDTLNLSIGMVKSYQKTTNAYINSNYHTAVGSLNQGPVLDKPILPAGIWHNETAILYTEFSNRFYQFTDTNITRSVSVKLTFTPDTSGDQRSSKPLRFILRRAIVPQVRNALLNVVPSTIDSAVIDTLTFAVDSSTKEYQPSSVTLPGSHFFLRESSANIVIDIDSLIPASGKDTVIKYALLSNKPKGIILTKPYYYLVPLDTGLIRIGSSTITVARTIKSPTDSSKDVTLASEQMPHAYSKTSIFESSISKTDFSTQAISSWAAGREAVVSMDLHPIWNSLEDSVTAKGYFALQSAMLALELTHLTTEKATTPESITIWFRIDSIQPDSTSNDTLSVTRATYTASSNTVFLDIREYLLKFIRTRSLPKTVFLRLNIQSQTPGTWTQATYNIVNNGSIRLLTAFSVPR